MTSLFGVYGTLQAARIGMGADVYWIGQQRDAGAVGWSRTGGREARHTAGRRLWGPTRGQSALDLEGEAAIQFGEVGNNAIRASMFAGAIGYSFRRARGAPRVYINLDCASGDAAPGGEVGTFSQLHPQPQPFRGLPGLAGRQHRVD